MIGGAAMGLANRLGMVKGHSGMKKDDDMEGGRRHQAPPVSRGLQRRLM
jgi:hypothetical protein